mgnify:CR=1 FL=1
MVKSAPNGKIGVEIAKTFLPDLIILDIMMPVMDGIDAGRMIRSIPDLKNTYILFLTARAEEYSEIAAFEVGADDYIIKPIKPRALLSRIQAFFRRETQKSEPDGILEIARENKNVVVLTADLAGSFKLGPLMKELPERFIEVGIAEANIPFAGCSMNIDA